MQQEQGQGQGDDDEHGSWIAKQRFEHGLCHQCGNAIYNVVYDGEGSKRRKRFESITLPDVVENGRCLLCYPIAAARRPNQASAISLQDDDDSTIAGKSVVVSKSTAKNAGASLKSSDSPPATRVKVEDVADERQPQVRKSPPRKAFKLKDSDGLEFVGTIQEGTQEKGHGKFIHGEGSKVIEYEGEFESGYFQGKGKSHDHGTGCVYEGDFMRGSAHGTGTCRWDQGWEYTGEWQLDKRHGKGKCAQLVDGGEVYEGEWKSDKWDGRGVLSFSGGGKYSGSFRKDKLHGFGSYEFADGSVYRGNFNNDLRHGHGEMTYACGLRYVGEWRDNWRFGKGTLFHRDGTVFKGRFAEDEKDGIGYLHLPDGIVRKEKWEMGNMLS